uniref:Ig-like domain-containing protein n=1 Tax=Ornithorhynchus anatinus TaxID=9258 RepID=A0A6I8MY93_ORNAN
MRSSCQGLLSSHPTGLLRAIGLLLGAWIVGAQGPPMNHTRGESALFRLNVSQTSDLRVLEWTFATKNLTIMELTLGPPGLSPNWTHERYRRRVHVVPKGFLQLLDVTPEDSGTYDMQARFRSGPFQKEVFTLAVYEPVPLPEIHLRPGSRTSGRCNFTLECRLPGAGAAVSVSWRKGDPPGELAAAERRGLSPDRRTLNLALSSVHPDDVFTCLARSPAQERNASVQLGDHCAPRPAKWLYMAIVLISVILVTLGAVLWFWKMKKREKASAARGRRHPVGARETPSPRPTRAWRDGAA